jgi:crossover junction endodeoxyribonuclease RuvC
VKVLGIDPGSKCCGFGVVEDAGGARVRHLAHGVLEVGDAGGIEERLRALHDGLSCELLRHRPQLVALEDVFHAKNARSALVLGQVRGVAILAAAQAGVRVRSFAPSVIKQAVAGTGRAEKEQVGRMVAVVLGIPLPHPLDASDALAAAICGLLRARDAEVPAAGSRGGWRAALARRLAK